MEVVAFVLVGVAAGWLAGRLRYGTGFGPAGNLIVGALGALLGDLLFRLLGLAATNLVGRLLSATAGAVLVLALLRAVLRRPGR